MAHDNVLYGATITANGTANLQLIYGSATVRSSAYGKAKLKKVQAWAHSSVGTDTPKVTVSYKNNTWTRGNKILAGDFMSPTGHAINTLCSVMDDAQLTPNSAFTVSAKELGGTITGTCTVYCLFTIDYDGVPGFNIEDYAGGCKICFDAEQASSFSTTANVAYRIGSYDLLDPGVQYLLNEVYTSTAVGMCFMILEGLAGQQGLSRLVPLLNSGTVISPSLQGSVKITKQSFTLGIIGDTALSSVTVPITLEMMASKNSIVA